MIMTVVRTLIFLLIAFFLIMACQAGELLQVEVVTPPFVVGQKVKIRIDGGIGVISQTGYASSNVLVSRARDNGYEVITLQNFILEPVKSGTIDNSKDFKPGQRVKILVDDKPGVVVEKVQNEGEVFYRVMIKTDLGYERYRFRPGALEAIGDLK